MKTKNRIILTVLSVLILSFGVKAQEAVKCDFSIFHEVEEFIKSNPEADFRVLASYAENAGGKVAESPDGNLRVLSFDLKAEGSILMYQNIVLYDENGKTQKFFGSIDRMATGKDNGAEFLDGCNVVKVNQVKLDDGRMLYLLFDDGRISFDNYCKGVTGYIFNDGKPEEYKCFDGKGRVSVCYSQNYWEYANVSSKANEEILCMDDENNKIYISGVSNGGELTGYYTVYQFNGTVFNNIGNDGGYWLNPSLRNYEKMECCFETENCKVRIDRLDDGTLRYVSWKSGEEQTAQPDVILNNGKDDFDDNRCYEFCSANTYYRVYDTEGERFLRIETGNKTVFEEDFKSFR